MNKLIALLLLACAFSAHALAPEDGIWYSPTQPGRGWVIITQNDLMAVSTYTYAANGAPVWYLSVGTFSDATKRFSAALNGTANGQCIGCPYRPPVSTGSAGTLQIQFIDAETAQLEQAGETVQIKKYYYGYGSLDDRLYGEWSFAGNVALGIGDAEFLKMDRAYTSPTTGRTFVSFRRKFSTLGTGLVAWDQNLGAYFALLQSSSSYYKAYEFKADGSRILDGHWWLYRTTESLSGSGDYMTGLRTGDKNDVGAVTKQSTDAAAQEARDAHTHAMMSATKSGGLDPRRQAIFDDLREQLRLLEPQADQAPALP